VSDPDPTFSSNRDRLTYLIAEYKVLVSGLVVGAVLLAIYYQVSLPQLPDWIPAVLIGWMLFGVPCYLVGAKIARWLRTRNWVTVHHVNSFEDDIEKHKVPPQIWAEKTVEGPDPYPVNGGDGWAVQEYEWLEDVEELRVKGVWLSGLEDTALFTSKSMMLDMHSWMLDQIEKLADTRAKWSRGVVQYEQETVNSFAEARERGVTLERTSGRDVFEDLTGEGDDEEIPSLDDEMPTIEDYQDGAGAGPPTEEDVEARREREEQLR
jgi:hypothetical protein